MEKAKIGRLCLGLMVLLYFGIIAAYITMCRADNETENTTTKYMATVKEVNITYIRNDVEVTICTEEYGSLLHIPTFLTPNINIEEIKEMKSGEKIHFQIPNSSCGQLNEFPYVKVTITSLATDEKTIFLLDDYNEYMGEAMLPTQIVGLVIIVFFSLLFLYFALKKRQFKLNGASH